MADRIKLGDYVVIQRQKYTKLQKFGSLDTMAFLGKEQLEMQGILDKPYGSTFKMCPKETIKASKGARSGSSRVHCLELCSENDLRNMRSILGISESGTDNRDIVDDGFSQNLGPEDIEQLREQCGSESTKIIEKIVENSKTFHTKTEYSQEKYLKKKEKKYFEYVKIKRPTVRLITEIYHRQEPEKIMGLNIDTISQMLMYSNVSAFGNHLLYESGSCGLLPAVFLNAIGSGTKGQLLHVHPGNLPQKQALLALNLPAEHMSRCISVNIYSVLREYYQNSAEPSKTDEVTEDSTETERTEPCSKKPKLDNEEQEAASGSEASKPQTNQQKWQLENKRACVLMREKLDSLVIAAKEHPLNIVNSLLPFIKPSRPLVIFSFCKEVLMELFVELKTSTNVTNLHLTENFLRMYQILPNRTHPEVNMDSNSGYVLYGYTVEPKSST